MIAWLLLLGWRGRHDPWSIGWLAFDVIQIGIVLITIAALSVLVVVVSRGLLGRPEMFVLGNGSYGNRLAWFDPAGPTALGMPWILTVSVWWYRVLMLLWGLWLAVRDPLAREGLAELHPSDRLASKWKNGVPVPRRPFRGTKPIDGEAAVRTPSGR